MRRALYRNYLIMLPCSVPVRHFSCFLFVLVSGVLLSAIFTYIMAIILS